MTLIYTDITEEQAARIISEAGIVKVWGEPGMSSLEFVLGDKRVLMWDAGDEFSRSWQLVTEEDDHA